MKFEFDRHKTVQPSVEKKQVEIEIFSVERYSLLPFHERESNTQLQNKGFHFPQYGGFQVFLLISAPQSKKIEKIRVPKRQIRSELIGGFQFLEFVFDKLFRLFGQGGALVEHAAYFVTQGSDIPIFNAAHLGVEILFELIPKRQDFDKMAPGQLFRQCRNNLSIREILMQSHHSGEIGLGVAAPIFFQQLFRQRRNNPFAILRSFTP